MSVELSIHGVTKVAAVIYKSVPNVLVLRLETRRNATSEINLFTDDEILTARLAEAISATVAARDAEIAASKLEVA